MAKINDYQRTTDLNWWLKWIACWITIVGAVANIMAADPWNVYLLNLGAAVYLWWSWRIREWSLITINCVLLAIYFAGTVMRVIN